MRKEDKIRLHKSALANGWTFLEYQENIKMVSYVKGARGDKDYARINIYYSTMTVGTSLTHPKQGKTQMFRKNVTMDELDKLFAKPRTHTNKGYKKNR